MVSFNEIILMKSNLSSFFLYSFSFKKFLPTIMSWYQSGFNHRSGIVTVLRDLLQAVFLCNFGGPARQL